MSVELDRNQHQGYFGECFVRVLASAAGLVVSRADLDVTGDDFTISHKGTIGRTRHPKIDVQVKTWSRRRAVWRNQHWNYALKAKHFNELAGTEFPLYRYLFLIIVPDEWADYATVGTDAVHLKYAGYWHSLRDRAPVNLAPNKDVPVPVPGANLLTVDRLRALMVPAEPARREA